MIHVDTGGLFSVPPQLIIPGKPVPASRPRVTRFGVYYSPTYTRWMKDNWQHVQALPETPTDSRLAVYVEALCIPPKSSKFDTPQGDLDNFAKGPLDLITKSERVWKDDRQIVVLVVSKRFIDPSEEPGFRIYWKEHK